MPQHADAFWVAAPGRGEIRHEPLAPPGDGDILVRALFSGISRGTEALVFAGRVPLSEYQRMRAPFQAGSFPSPVKYGYASVGIVEGGPDSLRGRHVFVLHPHQDWYVVPANAAHLLPDDVPPARAVLAANLETAINGVWDGRPHLGDRISIVGAGTVGCLVAWLTGQIPGCQVELVDVNPQRAEVARTLGVSFSTPADASRDADVVFHVSGSSDGAASALSLAAFEATVVEMSWFGNAPVSLPLGEAFHAKRLALRSSQVGTIPPDQRSRWDTRRRMAFALSLLRDSRLDALISGESRFTELPEVIARLAAEPGNTLCHRVIY